jgi:hypothetical protein
MMTTMRRMASPPHSTATTTTDFELNLINGPLSMDVHQDQDARPNMDTTTIGTTATTASRTAAQQQHGETVNASTAISISPSTTFAMPPLILHRDVSQESSSSYTSMNSLNSMASLAAVMTVPTSTAGGGTSSLSSLSSSVPSALSTSPCTAIIHDHPFVGNNESNNNNNMMMMMDTTTAPTPAAAAALPTRANPSRKGRGRPPTLHRRTRAFFY